MVKLFMFVRQKRNLEEALTIMKMHTGPLKNVKNHSSGFMSITGNTVIICWWLVVHINETMQNIRAVEREGNILAPKA